ncbi:dihydropteroate synthase [Sandaracinobacteroides hominis]|uniref:dihydropteroate synthase n=1 Tax=Sandaracinobacteroides hominis TaxID=2780086 RepID=UPI0018F62D9D|nr:dihydropteroate synthase [Sandaracinobacteroides hominis]
MGILNVTPDSFSDGGRHGTADGAIAAGLRMFEAGAAIVDVGGESTRPGAPEVSLEEELQRTIPVVEGLARAGVPVSIDTMKAGVMRAALAAGAGMLNDVSALQAEAESLAVAAGSKAQVVLMHMPGNPRTMQGLAAYDDVVGEVRAALAARIAVCEAAGLARGRLIADPGIGFGKGVGHNLALLRGLEAFHALGVPLLLGASRKSVIPAVAGAAPVTDRLPGSLAIALRGAEAGVAWLRVHDVAETLQALKLWEAMRG